MAGMSNIKILGLVAGALVIASFFLPWMVMTTTVLGVSDQTDITGTDIYDQQGQDYRFYPVIAMIASVFFVALLMMDRWGSVSAISGVVLGLAVILSCVLTYQALVELAVDSLFLTIEYTIGYGMVLALIGALGMIASASMAER